MIKGFRHKRLQAFWETGTTRGLNIQWCGKLQRILDALDRAGRPEDMNIPGFGFHGLIGRDAGRFSVRVNANWRVTFAFGDGDATEADLEDYH